MLMEIAARKRFAKRMPTCGSKRGKEGSLQCREMAAMKRASMDLTMSLPVLRKGM